MAAAAAAAGYKSWFCDLAKICPFGVGTQAVVNCAAAVRNGQDVVCSSVEDGSVCMLVCESLKASLSCVGL